MSRYPDLCSLELAQMEEAQSGRQESDDRRHAVLRPGKFGRGARFVMVFEKASELVLVIEAGEQVIADRLDVTLSQAVIEPLVITVVEALLLRGPFEVPIDLGHECEGRILRMNRGRGLWPERLRGQTPRALENLGQ